MLRKWHRDLLLVCILVSCLAGAWISSQLVSMHDGGSGTDTGDPGLIARLCRSVSTGGSGCEGAVHGAWSQISLSLPAVDGRSTVTLQRVQLPVAFVGLTYFVCLGTWFALVGGPRPIGAAWHRLVAAVAICGVGASAFFVGLMAFGGAPWCIGCVAVHMLNLIMTAAIGILWLVPPAPASASSATLTAREAWTAILVALLLVAGFYSYRQESLGHRYDVRMLEPYKEMVLSLQSDPQLLINAYLAQPRRRIEPRPGEVDSKSRRHLVVFTDFECDVCYLNSRNIREQVLKLFDRNLDVWIRHFPLCTHCNELVKESLHPDACRAAFAAETARLKRGPLAFELVYGLLFSNRKQLSDNIYRYIAVQIGIKPEAFLKDMDDPVVRQVIRDDIALGRELGVDGTPTMFLDGRRVPPLCLTPEFWKAAAKLPDPAEARPD